MNEFWHQLISAILIIIGCIKAVFGFFIMKKAVRNGDVRIALKRPDRASFRLLLALTKLTSDAPLYVILGVQVAQSDDPIYAAAAVWMIWCFIIQGASFMRWSEEQISDKTGDVVHERP